MSSATQQRRTERAGALAEKVSKKDQSNDAFGRMKRVLWWMFYSMLRTIVSMVWIKKIKLQLIGLFITQTNKQGYGFCLCDMERCYKTFFCA